MSNRWKALLASLSALLLLVAGTVVSMNFVTAAPGAVTVSFNYNGATSGDSVTSATVASGASADVVLPIPVKSGLVFTGWFSTQSLLAGQRITTISENDSGTLAAGYVPPELAQTLNLVLPPPPPPPSCANGGAPCVLGEIGPGGGLVFLISGGRTYEMAPKTWRGGSEDPLLTWCGVNYDTFTTGTAVGTGSANTTAMLTNVPPSIDACTEGAANAVRAYSGGGKTDWFLPSFEEVNALYNYKLVMPAGSVATYGFSVVGGNIYWSSSGGGSKGAQAVNFSAGAPHDDYTDSDLRVRAIRSFPSA